MTIAKSGLKMKPAPPPTIPRVPSGDATPSPTAGFQWYSTGEKIDIRGRSVTLRQLLIWLNEQTHRDIVDQTGLAEAYDFDLVYTLSQKSRTIRSRAICSTLLSKNTWA